LGEKPSKRDNGATHDLGLGLGLEGLGSEKREGNSRGWDRKKNREKGKDRRKRGKRRKKKEKRKGGSCHGPRSEFRCGSPNHLGLGLG
jgi:hypothetical protein